MVERIAKTNKTVNEETGLYNKNSRFGTKEYVSFMKKLHKIFLNDRNKNTLCSPFAVFLILSVVAKATDDEIRRVVVETLGVESLDVLEDIVAEACDYSNIDGEIVRQIARTSVWVKDGLKVNTELLKDMASPFNTDSFICEMGSEDANEELKNWLNESTNGFPEEMTGSLTLPKDSVLDLLATIYYAASWKDEFDESEKDIIFRGVNSKNKVKAFEGYDFADILIGDNFSVYERPLNAGSMFFILPNDESTPVEEVMLDPKFFDMINDSYNYENKVYADIFVKIPEFDVSSDGGITEEIKKLGLKVLFDSARCDFKTLNKSGVPIYAGNVIQAARIKVNKDGVEAAAAVEMICFAGCAPQFPDKKIKFVLDRPFGYVLIGAGGVPIMSGIINQL